MKRIINSVFALIVSILFLIGCDGATEDNNNIFNAAIVTVILVPVLLWIYLYIFKLIKKNAEDKQAKEEELLSKEETQEEVADEE